MDAILREYSQELKRDFEKNRRILTFSEYLQLVGQAPKQHLRGSAQYILDTIDFFGKVTTHGRTHFKIFDMEFSDTKQRVVGQNIPQAELYNTLKSFVAEGVNNKLILLHGPNGSAKSSMIHCLIKGMEHYSHQPEGALYKFNWVFPVDKGGKPGFGLASGGNRDLDSYARLPDEDIASRISCDLKDHPLLILPKDIRSKYVQSLTDKLQQSPRLPEYLLKGDLSHKSHLIFDALMTKYKGDLTKVLMHVQVERFYVSKRYRSAAVSIEPQMHVDGAARQLTADRSLAYLPPFLHHLTMYEIMGDLPDGNRGLIDFADLLKRPVDTFKYLLIACEQGALNIGPTNASLDTVFFGSTNELQLDAFKEFPDFTSFKARIELIRVPYLLEFSEEQKIYDVQVAQIAGNKPVAPHTTFVAALWAVLTRLKKPNPSHYASQLNEIISSLSPLDKAKLYDHGEVPNGLSAEQRKVLRSAIPRLREEYNSVPYYEGRVGASAREIKSILHDAAQDPDYECLMPLGVFKVLENFVKHVSEYEFLKQDVRDGYHDACEFINVVRNEWLSILDQEVRESMGIFQKTQYEDFLKKYIAHLSVRLKGEKIKNPITGKMEPPDERLLQEFEDIVEAPQGGKDRDGFRQGVISSIGAYSLDHPNQPVEYKNVFPEFMVKLENHFFEQQKSKMKAMGSALEFMGTDKVDYTSDAAKLAQTTLANMQSKFSYNEYAARMSILYLIKKKYL
jgi:predicted Ser/Thr protein kinase